MDDKQLKKRFMLDSKTELVERLIWAYGIIENLEDRLKKINSNEIIAIAKNSLEKMKLVDSDEVISIEKKYFNELVEVLRLYNQEDETVIYSEPDKLSRNMYWINIGRRGAVILEKFGIKPDKDFIV